MNWDARVRQWHRWLAMVFIVGLVVTIVGTAVQGPAWLAYVFLPPLALLLFSGLFVMWRSRGTAVTGVRRVHRWSGIALTVLILATFVALALPDPLVWVSYLPLIPLAILLGTGIRMLVLYYRRRTSGRVAAAA
ncbi:hypothetical protein [Nocardia huaxiensis]|nr:hypothetical protein [Nocardia huaxiensis]UFS97170.1 hypothetical protein LPY97_04370 [Nocardia huaxiensis]